MPGSAELLYPAQLGISTSLCKKFPRLRNPTAPLYDFFMCESFFSQPLHLNVSEN
ncbi:MAG: hypothetical protein GQF41_0043 [Candidatus Rifleibacterium amylolyticum]|nr:MAG: hypothetical protein GQF41_0043 [Candidatus Rifleibacterium amylolyticum]